MRSKKQKPAETNKSSNEHEEPIGEANAETRPESDYYYDDSHGYEIYRSSNDDEDDDDAGVLVP